MNSRKPSTENHQSDSVFVTAVLYYYYYYTFELFIINLSKSSKQITVIPTTGLYVQLLNRTTHMNSNYWNTVITTQFLEVTLRDGLLFHTCKPHICDIDLLNISDFS
uniref:Ovule protein n=1 Tax=Heterorhabditis bacteriophora TaxID=37862 RepID=A0A1I7WF17_HETBA